MDSELCCSTLKSSYSCIDHPLSVFQLFVVSTACNLIAKMSADLSHMFLQQCAVQLVVTEEVIIEL